MKNLTPVTFVTIAFVSGIFICKIAIDYIFLNVIILLAMSFIWFVSLFILNKLRLFRAFEFATILFCSFVGATLFLIRYNNVKNGILQDKQYVKGSVIDIPTKSPNSWAVTIKTDDNIKIKTYLYPHTCPRIGDIIELYPSYGFQQTCPQFNTDSVYGEYRKYLFYSGISATCYAGKNRWHVVGKIHDDLFLRLHEMQAVMLKKYKDAGFKGDEGAVISAMTTGNKATLSKKIQSHYSRSGVSHVLALSGFHLTLLYTMIEWLLFAYIAPRKWRIFTQFVSIALVITFTIIAGAPASLVRAAIMCTLMSLANVFQNDNSSMNSLSLAALIMLSYNPLMLFDVGFQLSFASMVGLCSVCLPMTMIINISNKLLYNIWLLICCTITCSLFTLPLVAYYFGYFPLLSLFSNILISLVASILLFLSALWWIFYFLPIIQEIIGHGMIFSASIMNSITDYISSIKWAVCDLKLNLLGVIMSYILLIFLLWMFKYIEIRNCHCELKNR